MYEGCKEILVEVQDRILLIKFNNPAKRNCVNRYAYDAIGRAMRQVATDENITMVVFTGVGDYYTAGNDLSQSSASDAANADMEAYMKQSNQIFIELVCSFIECPKVIVALVNGPCIGIGATLAALSDLVYCEESAYFLTPFVKLGIVPEACSTYLFPLILGRAKANEMLLFGEKLTAVEALKYGFSTKTYKRQEVDSVIWPKLREYSELPRISLLESKKLIRSLEKDVLYKALRQECDELHVRLRSDEFFEALVNFANRKNKSKL